MSTRPETAPMQFEGDWPGVFIRGDNALAYVLAIDDLLRSLEHGHKPPVFAKLQVQQLSKLLAGCDNRLLGSDHDPETVQRLKPFEECKP